MYGTLPDDKNPVQLFISPSQYIEGHGVIRHLGEYLSVCISGRRAGVLITPGREKAYGAAAEAGLARGGFTMQKTIFQGESTLSEAKRVAAFFDCAVDVVIGIGGGKCLDTARMAASRLQVPVVTVPTTASTDAPTAAHSVVYDENGAFRHIEFQTTNPLMVLVDLDIVADAPERYIVAGMGDAYSTFYEARCCMENPAARTARGARPTMAALAIARECRDLLLKYGANALKEIREKQTGDAFAHVVEANILLSGLGFESGGLAGAHGVAQGLTASSELHSRCLHGELVAIGVITQLIMERNVEEAKQAARFFKEVGLPLHLGQLNFDPLQRHQEMDAIIERSLGVFFMYYEPFPVTHESLKAAMLDAYGFGIVMEKESA